MRVWGIRTATVAMVALLAETSAFAADASDIWAAYLAVPDAKHSSAARRHTGIPSVAVAGNRLWVTYYGGPTGGEDSNNFCVLEMSEDRGMTWRPVLVADPDGDGPKRAFDPEVWAAPDGRFFWTWTERTVPLQKDSTDANAGCKADPKDDALMGVAFDPAHMPSPESLVPRRFCRGVMMCKPIVLDDGTWLWPSAHWGDAPSACFYESTDRGETFSLRGGVTLPEENRQFDEHAAVQLRNGDLLAFIRTIKGTGCRESRSHDRGRTWSVPKPARIAHTSSRLFLRKLRSGNLLLIKHGSLDKDVGRTDLTAYLFEDDGETWKGGLLIDARKDAAYPDGDQAPDGTIYLVHDRDRLGAQEVLLSAFTEADVLAGRLVADASFLRRVVTRTPASGTAAPVFVGKDLQVLWDDAVVDAVQTTASRVLHRPEYAGGVIDHDRPWEGDACGYHTVFKDGDIYRMYYNAAALGWAKPRKPVLFTNNTTRICYCESRDGIHWTRPNLGIFAFNGSKDNNIILDTSVHEKLEEFYVFKDTNPNCPKDELYKALTSYEITLKPDEPPPTGFQLHDREWRRFARGLAIFTSPDGLHFRYNRPIPCDGRCDSLNVCFWDATRGKYFCYYRGLHSVGAERNGDRSVRDVRVLTSADGRTWTAGKRLDYGEGAEDYSMYTSGVQPYLRNPKLFVGLPTRYVERKEWTKNYNRLPRPEARRFRFDKSRREGLALTDCVFMFSRDGERFCRFDEAFLRPGPQGARNWVYGDCYPAPGMLLLPGREDSQDVLSLYSVVGHVMGEGESLCRYTIRMDGFVSRQAPYAGAKVVTKPLVFAGAELLVNFSTSARGRMFVTVRDAEGAERRSVELFGDEVDRIVDFEPGADLASFAGRPVTLTFEMSDADLYSFRFQ